MQEKLPDDFFHKHGMKSSPAELEKKWQEEEKKAIQSLAEKLALQDSQSTPEAKHFIQASWQLDLARNISGTVRNQLVAIALAEKELRDTIGNEPFLKVADKIQKSVNESKQNIYDKIVQALSGQELGNLIQIVTEQLNKHIIPDVKSELENAVLSDDDIVAMQESNPQTREKITQLLEIHLGSIIDTALEMAIRGNKE